MTLYIGVDFHPHQQTAVWCDTETGETETVQLFHKNPDEVRKFYASFGEAAVVGMEASSKALWFERLLESLGQELRIGDPYQIRKMAVSRHKNDSIDANHILSLLLDGRFPAIWRRSPEQNEILDMLRFRVKIVGQRTAAYNRLQSIAHSCGLPKGKMSTLVFQEALKASDLTEGERFQMEHLFELLGSQNERIDAIGKWLDEKAGRDPKVQLLMTQFGVGTFTALAVVNTLGDVTRFDRVPAQVTNFIGYDSREGSSGARTRYGAITKAGPPLVRYLVGQAAMVAVRKDPGLKAFHKRLSKRKHPAVAKTATARKLLVKLSIMLRDNISAQEFDRRGSAVGDARRSAGPEMADA
ncbi:MAG: IS110 family transposase [Pyrinomonadaceae bacterium]